MRLPQGLQANQKLEDALVDIGAVVDLGAVVDRCSVGHEEQALSSNGQSIGDRDACSY